ncbi:FAD/NAD(P)-binding domain-containing protein [Ophiobolus disseminans]|uniref:FAD/NAD(P)-binding domain-containing protein n=1 Tax=Ophiobolus disseminans TaxID=1469910 RepID=A0A6A7ABG8_9PLEO|nr:FAD/NAD(P)-binding domain-containing protein [Ophiobolus disseminans]
MKVIIVGGGIVGLATYLHLRKHLPNPSSNTITIFESHKPSSSSPPYNGNLDTLSASPPLIGAGLGISPNGMRVLRDLNPDLYASVVAQGFRAERFVFKGANGWTLSVQSTSDKAVRGDGESEEVCVASSRHGLRETIMRYVDEGAVDYRQVVGVERLKGGKVGVMFEDGEVEEADLVIGADGVRSVVREALFGGDERYKPVYTGQSGVGGFLNAPIPHYITDNKAMVFCFGGNGFFGYSSGGPPAVQQLMWWSTFEMTSLSDTKAIDPGTIKVALVERHKHWKDSVVKEIIQKAEVQSIYPTWALPELPHWGERGIVLVGDAAHAMDPTTGQGASQAIEDAQTFAILLGKLLEDEPHNDNDADVINTAIKLFYKIRAPRVHAINERGKKLAGNKTNLGLFSEYSMYCLLWLIDKLPFIGEFPQIVD